MKPYCHAPTHAVSCYSWPGLISFKSDQIFTRSKPHCTFCVKRQSDIAVKRPWEAAKQYDRRQSHNKTSCCKECESSFDQCNGLDSIELPLNVKNPWLFHHLTRNYAPPELQAKHRLQAIIADRWIAERQRQWQRATTGCR